MKKLLTILVSILLVGLNLQMQPPVEYEYVPFPTSNAIWSEVYYFTDDIWWEPPSYERFTVNGEDTVINDIIYKKIYMFFDTFFDINTAIYVGALREDENKRVWLKMDSPVHPNKPAQFYANVDEILLYDFSVNVGDTINSEYLNIHCHYVNIVVEKIDTIQIDNSYRRKIKIIGIDDDFVYDWYSIEWIEGIGSTQGLFFTTEIDGCGCGAQNKLICFKQDGEILYFDNYFFDECFPFSRIEHISNKSEIIVYSNLLRDNIIFDFGQLLIMEMQIYDITGRLCHEYDVCMQTTFVLPKNHYKSGIYLYKAINKNGNVYAGKFIIK